jgi:hypothetical protein
MAQDTQVSQQALDSISTPERVETPIGTLEFPLGVPTEDTANRVYDHLDHLHAVSAFLNALSGVNIWALRRGFLEAGIRDNDVVLWSEMMDAKTLLLGGSADSIYYSSFLDLTEGPLVVEIPPLTLTFLNDMWGRWVADGGLGGPDRGVGGRYLLVPPAYEGPLPDGGFFVSRCRTTRIFLWGRAFLEDDDPKPGAERIRQTLRIYPYAPGEYGTSIGDIVTGGPAPALPWTSATWVAALQRPAAPRFVEGTGLAMNTVPPNDESFFTLASELVHDQPAEALDAEIAGELAAVGIVKGKPFEPDARMRQILTDAAAVGNATARTLLLRSRVAEGAHYYGETSQWTNGLFTCGHDFMTPPAPVTEEGVQQSPSDGARKLNARTWWFYLGWGVSPAMSMLVTETGSQYLAAAADKEGRPLDGGKHYELRFPPDIPAARFWSVTVYDNETRSMLDTPQRFPKAGSQGYPRPAVSAGPDGSTTVHFGPDRPDGVPEGNWVQTVPGKGWYVGLRLYSPLKPFFDKTWRPGEIELAPRVPSQR